jgi:hypothetical protein
MKLPVLLVIIAHGADRCLLCMANTSKIPFVFDGPFLVILKPGGTSTLVLRTQTSINILRAPQYCLPFFPYTLPPISSIHYI